MALINDDVVFHKGFYTSTKAPIMEKHGNLHGNFALSLDHVMVEGITKRIVTIRKFVTSASLESLLDTLFDEFGNYHLNYLVFFSRTFFGEDSGATHYNTEINKFVMKSHKIDGLGRASFDKNVLFGEFHTIRDILKSKVFARQTAKMLFVNDNIYTTYIYTGMHKTIS